MRSVPTLLARWRKLSKVAIVLTKAQPRNVLFPARWKRLKVKI